MGKGEMLIAVELEAPLPLEGAVAGAAVAADPAHQRQDVPLEVGRLLRVVGREASRGLRHGLVAEGPDG